MNVSPSEFSLSAPAGALERDALKRNKRRDKSPARIIPGAEPFSLPGGPAGCLLVHGFTSTPYDVHACGAYLSARGIAAEGVLLAGHGTSPEDLADTHLEDWLNSIRAAHARLAQHASHVFALGVSLAGNFLVTLAAELSLDGLILVGMPLKLRHQRSYRALYYVYRALGKQYQKKWYQRSLDRRIREERPNYDRIPLACGSDVLAALRRSRENLKRVTCPVLAMQSTTDHALRDDTMDSLRSLLGTTDVVVQWIPDRYHVVLIDHGKEDVFENIYQFIRSRTPSP